jgi:hypothetical protein
LAIDDAIEMEEQTVLDFLGVWFIFNPTQFHCQGILMKKHSLLFVTLFSFNLILGINPQELRDEINRLQEQLNSKYIYSWFALGMAGLAASKYMSHKAESLAIELKEKWFWNPVTEQEELPEGVDESTISLWYWGGHAATIVSCLSLIGGVKQWVSSLLILRQIKIIKEAIETEERSQRFGEYDPTTELPDHYATLGIAPTATEREIKLAYRKLALANHPDKNPAGAARFKEVGEAYGILVDASKRTAYDAERRRRGIS